mmetsp:Transcript_1634/g.3780  ORF Transcript_1634/g.3780 Transcript_1634/m.3780 type:complete len:721 (+) Transcript_1634:251-2413(+)
MLYQGQPFGDAGGCLFHDAAGPTTSGPVQPMGPQGQPGLIGAECRFLLVGGGGSAGAWGCAPDGLSVSAATFATEPTTATTADCSGGPAPLRMTGTASLTYVPPPAAAPPQPPAGGAQALGYGGPGMSPVGASWSSPFSTMQHSTVAGAIAQEPAAPGQTPWAKPYEGTATAPGRPLHAFGAAPPALPPAMAPPRSPDDANAQQAFGVFNGVTYFGGGQQQNGHDHYLGRVSGGGAPGHGAAGYSTGSYGGYGAGGPVTDPTEYHRRLQGLPVPGKRVPQSLLADADLRREYQIQKTCMLMSSKDLHSSQVAAAVPDTVQSKYFCLCLLDDESKGRSARFCGSATYVYKALAIDDPQPYCLRRIDGFHIANFGAAAKAVERWLKLEPHPCVCALRQLFATQEFVTQSKDAVSHQDTASLVFVYDYLPNASTLENSHFTKPCPENLLWVYISQLALALRHIHSVGLAARVVEPSKILVSHRNRVHLNCVGVLDALRHDPSFPIGNYQKQDLVSLGRLILALVAGSMSVLSDVHKSVDRVLPATGGMFSGELRNLVVTLLTLAGQHQAGPTIHDVLALVHARVATQLEHQLHFGDALECELMKEVDNGRLFKIICKLGTICERPHFNNDPHWAETGDRYLCKLFRDYLFHQCDESGAPHLDMGHIVDCLNKVDVGVPEKIMLMSQDESSVLVVSFMDVKRCIENAFNEISVAAAPLPITHAH